MLNGGKKDLKPKNVVFLAMRLTRRAVVHGKTKKAARRAANQNLFKEAFD
jgi:hypothetical protein